MAKRKSDYDKVWTHLQRLVPALRKDNIPDHEMFPALADFLVLCALASGQNTGLSEPAVEALIERMKGTLDDWRHGREPFTEINKKTMAEGRI